MTELSEIGTDPNPHVLWRQVVGLLLWLGPLSFFAGGLVAMILVLLLGVLTFADAWLCGISKNKEKSSFLNISPMGWGIVVPMLLIIAWPTYVASRSRIKTKEGSDLVYGFVLLVGGVEFILALYSIFVLIVR